MSKNLDEIDLKILSEIQADGRITNVELARRVGISPPPCLRRVRTLEEEGYIQGYRGLLDPRRLGFDVTVFASVHLSSQADADLRAFEEFVRAEPLVRECWMLSGEVDFILKCVAPDMATFQDFVTHLTAAPHVRNVRTSLVLHNSKYEAAVPLEVKVRGNATTGAKGCVLGQISSQGIIALPYCYKEALRKACLAGSGRGSKEVWLQPTSPSLCFRLSLFCVAIFFKGGGRYSVDHMIASEF